ncbi:hypothetical protein [Rhodovulum viride]|uniref:hypothetical protein n=1 Tax=Rhodovulum viride TaxID=1231134 RepID=UPI0015EB4561|nr:hypothetical protein [Rhodovulum viride]
MTISTLSRPFLSRRKGNAAIWLPTGAFGSIAKLPSILFRSYPARPPEHPRDSSPGPLRVPRFARPTLANHKPNTLSGVRKYHVIYRKSDISGNIFGPIGMPNTVAAAAARLADMTFR